MTHHNIDPHQLDYDWRFDPVSQALLAKCAVAADRVLLLGCPSLLEILEAHNNKGLLLERNPIHLPTKHFNVEYSDVRFLDALPFTDQKYDLAILDAPWYPHDLFRWINAALVLVKIGASIFFVLWPKDTRPSAPLEHAKIKASLNLVGELSEAGEVSYEMPLFERLSTQRAGRPFGRRVGHLFKLTKLSEKLLQLDPTENIAGRWERFTLGNTQIAIKIGIEESSKSSNIGFERSPFVLSSTSRRDPSLKMINIWTSQNIVAQLRNPKILASGIREGARPTFDILSRYFAVNFSLENDVRGVEWQHRA